MSDQEWSPWTPGLQISSSPEDSSWFRPEHQRGSRTPPWDWWLMTIHVHKLSRLVSSKAEAVHVKIPSCTGRDLLLLLQLCRHNLSYTGGHEFLDAQLLPRKTPIFSNPFNWMPPPPSKNLENEATESCEGSKKGYLGRHISSGLLLVGWHVYFTCIHVVLSSKSL